MGQTVRKSTSSYKMDLEILSGMDFVFIYFSCHYFEDDFQICRFCGKEGPFINTRSPVGLRDLFVVFVSGKDDDDSIVEAAEFEHDGFLCTARCRKAGG